ncbi:hypothetical protein J6590_034042 [Homalodisca vitripennis]|nr:hypothetical protein J6590_034042 [Homalodisca vitripennis]
MSPPPRSRGGPNPSPDRISDLKDQFFSRRSRLTGCSIRPDRSVSDLFNRLTFQYRVRSPSVVDAASSVLQAERVLDELDVTLLVPLSVLRQIKFILVINEKMSSQSVFPLTNSERLYGPICYPAYLEIVFIFLPKGTNSAGSIDPLSLKSSVT